eukprot:m.263636 g.263636  ORF g.263636 m.263636 type:complete len:195 (+) comp40458_c0_seq8:1135-1719(+)
MIRSPAVWAITIAYCTNDWAFFTLITNVPTFLNDVLGFSIAKDGFLSALPYALTTGVLPIAGWISDTLRKRRILSTTNTRKLMNSSGQLLMALFLVITGYSMNKWVAFSCLCLAVSLFGFTSAGFMVNHLDVSPRYAGFLMGLTNTIATLPGILAPYVAGVMTPSRPGSPHLHTEWRNVFSLPRKYALLVDWLF